MEMMEQTAGVAVVLLLLGATLWILRRRGFAGVEFARRKPDGRRMECVARLTLGPHQVIHLVRLGETELLLASSTSGCTLLKSFGPHDAEAGR